MELELEKAFLNFDAKYLLVEAEKMAVPLGLIRNMKEVFDLQIANELILDETIEGQETKRLKSLIFKYNKQ